MLEVLRLKLEEKLTRYQELEQQMADPDVAANATRYTTIAREYTALGKLATRYRELKRLATQIAEANELLADPDMADMAHEELARLEPLHEEREAALVDVLLAEPDEEHDRIIMEIRAGTGGEEASLWCRDLFEMYRRYAEENRWKVEVLDFNVSDQRGYKDVSFSLAGEDVYRLLRYESGGHRVQRVPETEAQGRIHTSAATVAVMAEPEEVQIDIRDEDIEMEAIRSSGPGGQHVNKTSSAVRLTHKPTGVVVLCQEERSQHKNRSKAMRLLRSRIYDAAQREKQSARAAERRSLIGSGDRSERIRTYNFPQGRCTDHRINQNFNLETIVAGNLNKLLEALQEHARKEKLEDLADEM